MYMDTTYLLDFAPKKSRIISYSSSFSVNTIPAEYRSIYINCLKRYDAISVRENGGNVLVSDLLNTNAKVVLDPTLLLNKEDWKQLEIKANWKSRLPENTYYVIHWDILIIQFQLCASFYIAYSRNIIVRLFL